MFVLIASLHQCNITEQEALHILYETTGGQLWNQKWEFEEDHPDLVCQLPGVTCQRDNLVIELDLTGYGLFGQIPAEIECLT